MSKQYLQNNNMDVVSNTEKASGHSITNTNLSTQSHLPRGFKAVLLVAGVLAVVAIFAAVITVVAVKTSQEINYESRESEKGMEWRGDPLIDVKTKEQLLKQIADSKRIGKRQAASAASKTQTTEASCYSILTNKTHPAAHIAGQGFRWTSAEPGSRNSPPGHVYQTSWVCANKSDAYVDGGMFFNQKDQKLYVPTCGYYYISSHIFFQSDPSISNSDSNYVRHQIRVERNCNYSDDWLLLRSYSSLTSTPENIGRTTTYIGDVVKMCSGGTISIIIPNDRYNPCCPYGRSQTTYLSAFMVAETTCDPPRAFDIPQLAS